MEFRHTKLQALFKQLDQKVNMYLSTHAETCLEENGEDPNGFYECMKTHTANFRENFYKFENLSLYTDLRENECSKDTSNFDQCLNGVLTDVKRAMDDLEGSFE